MKAEIFTYKQWISGTNPSKISELFTDLLIKSDFKIINQIEHHFDIQGYTCLWLISESHLAVHTFPEENKTYVELSSCNEAKNETFKKLLEKENLSC